MRRALVCGAGGFIGSHLVKRLKREGFWVRGVDLKYPRFSRDRGRRLRHRRSARAAALPRRSTAASTRSTNSPPTWAAPATSSPASTTPTSCTTRRRSTSTCSMPAAAAIPSASSIPRRPASTRSTTRRTRTTGLRRGLAPIRPPPTASTAGRSCSASGSISPTPAITAWRSASRASTTSSGPRAPGTADGEGAGRPLPQGGRGARPGADRDLGRWRADPLVPLYRRVPRGLAAPDALGLRRRAQHRLRRDGHHQRSGGDDRRRRRQGVRSSTSPGLSASGAATRTTASSPRNSGGVLASPSPRHREDLSLDCRPSRGIEAAPRRVSLERPGTRVFHLRPPRMRPAMPRPGRRHHGFQVGKLRREASSRFANDASATSTGGSPGRRAPSFSRQPFAGRRGYGLEHLLHRVAAAGAEIEVAADPSPNSRRTLVTWASARSARRGRSP